MAWPYPDWIDPLTDVQGDLLGRNSANGDLSDHMTSYYDHPPIETALGTITEIRLTRDMAYDHVRDGTLEIIGLRITCRVPGHDGLWVGPYCVTPEFLRDAGLGMAAQAAVAGMVRIIQRRSGLGIAGE